MLTASRGSAARRHVKFGKAASKAALLVSIGQTLSLAEGAIWSRLRGLTEAKLGALGFCYRASHKKKDHIGFYGSPGAGAEQDIFSDRCTPGSQPFREACVFVPFNRRSAVALQMTLVQLKEVS